MNFSVSLQSANGDRYYVYLSPLNKDWWNDLNLPEDNLEIYQVVLDREQGSNTTDLHIISEISKFLAKVFLSNDLIFYYVCDDMNEIPSGTHEISSQEYRSRLFSKMFDRYVSTHSLTDISDTPIVIRDAVGNNQYVHIIARNKHVSSIDYLVNYIQEGFGTGK